MKLRHFGLTLSLCCGFIPFALAQEKKADAPKAGDAKAAPADAQKAGGGPEGVKPAVTDADKLAFEQSKIVAEMNELEKRMFRLGEALSKLEPENSSRLRMALKYAREELILLKLRTSQEFLEKKSYVEASAELAQSVAKLQRLEELLLAKDLDFQMKLERLRKLNEVLKQLDNAIAEEKRQLKNTKPQATDEDRLAELKKRQASLGDLIAEQKKHVDDGKKLTEGPSEKAAAGAEAAKQLGNRQESTRQRTQGLAATQPKEAGNIGKAAEEMGGAVSELNQAAAKKAAPKQQAALDELQKELDKANEEAKQLAKRREDTKFDQIKRDEGRNRKLTEEIASNVRQLGQNGASAMEELQRAAGSQGKAESSLGQKQAQSASESQQSALQSLQQAREQLAQEREKLLEELQPEIHARVMAAVAEMIEKELAIRAATELAGPKAAAGVPAAQALLVNLSKDQAGVIGIAETTITLCEDTDFSIAMPDALRVVKEQMTVVKERLAAKDGSAGVVEVEKRIIDDLRDLLAALKQMPSNRQSKTPPSKIQDPREREKELNRLISELRMVRLMQMRVNGETVKTDRNRPTDTLPDPVRESIGRLEKMQIKVRDTTGRISRLRERGLDDSDSRP
ncbi:MAG TPA: hypothetical protein VNC50_00885 [Planctomycetia bacterium]|nr:hypothetical protein [Planctomycetia bacterium]